MTATICSRSKPSRSQRARRWRKPESTATRLTCSNCTTPFTILSVLALEAAGFAERGEGWKLANQIGLDGTLPISTFGGLKSRGNPVGATGVYQAVEAVLQLRGAAGANQVADAKVALIQSVGGLGSTAITHVLQS